MVYPSPFSGRGLNKEKRHANRGIHQPIGRLCPLVLIDSIKKGVTCQHGPCWHRSYDCFVLPLTTSNKQFLIALYKTKILKHTKKHIIGNQLPKYQMNKPITTGDTFQERPTMLQIPNPKIYLLASTNARKQLSGYLRPIMACIFSKCSTLTKQWQGSRHQ